MYGSCNGAMYISTAGSVLSQQLLGSCGTGLYPESCKFHVSQQSRDKATEANNITPMHKKKPTSKVPESITPDVMRTMRMATEADERQVLTEQNVMLGSSVPAQIPNARIPATTPVIAEIITAKRQTNVPALKGSLSILRIGDINSWFLPTSAVYQVTKKTRKGDETCDEEQRAGNEPHNSGGNCVLLLLLKHSRQHSLLSCKAFAADNEHRANQTTLITRQNN